MLITTSATSVMAQATDTIYDEVVSTGDIITDEIQVSENTSIDTNIDDSEFYLDKTMEAVFECLNNSDISIENLGIQNYSIPINGEIVDISISNEEDIQGRGIGEHRDYLSANRSYTFTLTVRNFYLNSGKKEMLFDFQLSSQSTGLLLIQYLYNNF